MTLHKMVKIMPVWTEGNKVFKINEILTTGLTVIIVLLLLLLLLTKKLYNKKDSFRTQMFTLVTVESTVLFRGFCPSLGIHS